MGTLAAFWLFERAGLDFAVLEVGLGGRLDAVNLIDADLALITSIGLDHAEWLGDTRESVAFEKAGILRAGKPALCGDLDPPQPLLEQVTALGAPLYLRGRDYDLALVDHGWHWRGLAADGQALALHDLPLLGLPMENAALALQAYALLELPWQAERLAEALRRTRVTGRLDRRDLSWDGQPRQLLLDVGHNPQAAQYLAQRLRAAAPRGRYLAVFGLLADKDLDGVLEPLTGLVQDWAVAPLPTPRSRPAAELEAALILRQVPASSHADIAAALDAQCAKATADDVILLFGSFYSVAEGLSGWPVERIRGVNHGLAGKRAEAAHRRGVGADRPGGDLPADAVHPRRRVAPGRGGSAAAPASAGHAQCRGAADRGAGTAARRRRHRSRDRRGRLPAAAGQPSQPIGGLPATPPPAQTQAPAASPPPSQPQPPAAPPSPPPAEKRLDANNLPQSWSVQLASLSNRARAEELQKTLRSQGYNAYIRSFDGMNRVFVGPVIQRAEADRLRDQLSKQQKLNGFVVRFQPERG